MRSALALVILAATLAGCRSDEAVVIGKHGPVRVAADADRVRAIIAAERDLQVKEQRQEPPPRRREFLDALQAAPGFDVTGAADGIIVASVPECHCGLHATSGNYMVKVQITSGPLAGRSGWVCNDQVASSK